MLFKIHTLKGNIQLAVVTFNVAQWTRTDAVLPNIDLSATPTTPSTWLVKLEENYNDLAYRIDRVLTKSPNSAYLFLLLIPIMFYLAEKRTVVGYTLSISIVSLILITCTGAKKKEFPFAALMASSGITSDTPSIGDNGSADGNGQTTSNTQPNNSGQTTGLTPHNNTNNHPSNNGQASGNTQLGGSGASSAGTPVTGFYFLHRDYLDSVTMITNGQGEMVSGMDISTGKSVVDYKPYGEIDRKNSDGPDIFRYKYTGQEEDRETGLYYYKARYYDPEIGRFIEPDSYMNGSSIHGMNQYAYVEGNPIMYNDPTGHSKLSAFMKKNSLGSLNFNLKTLNLRKSWVGRRIGSPLYNWDGRGRRYEQKMRTLAENIQIGIICAPNVGNCPAVAASFNTGSGSSTAQYYAKDIKLLGTVSLKATVNSNPVSKSSNIYLRELEDGKGVKYLSVCAGSIIDKQCSGKVTNTDSFSGTFNIKGDYGIYITTVDADGFPVNIEADIYYNFSISYTSSKLKCTAISVNASGIGVSMSGNGISCTP